MAVEVDITKSVVASDRIFLGQKLGRFGQILILI
jgi:hypothetical protein